MLIFYSSDILTEIDDVPSTISLGLLASFAERDPGRNGYTDILAGADDSEPPSRAYIDSHLWLRSMLNKILVELYGPDNAYGQPHDISHLVQNLSGQLQSWYLSVPPSQQFENTIRFPGTTESDIPDSLVREYPEASFCLSFISLLYIRRDCSRVGPC